MCPWGVCRGGWGAGLCPGGVGAALEEQAKSAAVKHGQFCADPPLWAGIGTSPVCPPAIEWHDGR